MTQNWSSIYNLHKSVQVRCFLLGPMSIIIVVLLASMLNVNASFIWTQKLENLDKIHDTKLKSNL